MEYQDQRGLGLNRVTKRSCWRARILSQNLINKEPIQPSLPQSLLIATSQIRSTSRVSITSFERVYIHEAIVSCHARWPCPSRLHLHTICYPLTKAFITQSRRCFLRVWDPFILDQPCWRYFHHKKLSPFKLTTLTIWLTGIFDPFDSFTNLIIFILVCR